MKQLTLIRHAKSSWKATELEDFDRPLNKRGTADLPKMCERLIAYQILPDYLIFSPALRTDITAKAIISHLNLPAQTYHACQDIYEASIKTLLRTIQIVPDDISHLMLVGHNPGLQDLGSTLIAQSIPHFPTSAILHLGLNIDHWSETQPKSGICLNLDYPKLHLS